MPKTSPAQTKPVYHIIPESRMAGIQSFSSWKERLPSSDNLAEFERSVARAVGEKMANGIATCMRDAMECQVPSVIVNTGEEILHLPPKISYLFRMAATNRRSDSRDLLIGSFAAKLIGAGKAVPDNLAIALLRDISMGEPRINSVCCCHTQDNLGKWQDWLAAEDPQRMVRVLKLTVMQCTIVDSAACSGATDVFRRFLVRAGLKEREMLIAALFSEAGARGEVTQVLDDAAGWGRVYATRGQVSSDPEAIILLSSRIIRGSFLSEQEVHESRANVAPKQED